MLLIINKKQNTRGSTLSPPTGQPPLLPALPIRPTFIRGATPSAHPPPYPIHLILKDQLQGLLHTKSECDNQSLRWQLMHLHPRCACGCVFSACVKVSSDLSMASVLSVHYN